MALRNSLFAILSLVGLMGPAAQAQCTSPAGVAGARDYISGTFKLCDGTNWTDFSTDGNLGACTGAGKMEFDDTVGAYKFCNNSSLWTKIKKTSSCTVSALTYQSKVTSVAYLDAANGVKISPDGTKAYVFGQFNNRVSIYNISASPAAPTLLGSTATNANLNDASDMRIWGNYAFVTARNTDNLVVVDISNAAAPAYVTRVQSSPTNQMANVWGLDLSDNGNYAYAVSWNSGAASNKCFFNAFNISTPTSPTYAGGLNVTDGGAGGIVYCNRVLIKGNYAFVSFGEGALVVIDVSNPASPTYVTKVTNANAGQLESMDFSEDENYIFATTTANNRFHVFNVTNPTAPSHVTFLTNATYWGGAYGVKTVGKYVLTGGSTSDTLGITDVSNPASPTTVAAYTSATNMDGATDVAVYGRYAYVAGYFGDSLYVVDMGCDPSTPTAGSCSLAKSVDYDSGTKTLSYCDGSQKRVMAQGSSCGGVLLGGFCWYAGGSGESCTTVCSTRGGYNAGTQTYAGSGGSAAQCGSALDAVGLTGTAVSDLACGTLAIGCTYDTSTDRYRCTGTATTAAASNAGSRRVCACNN